MQLPNRFNPTLEELGVVLAPKYHGELHNLVITNMFLKGVFCTFSIPDTVTINGENFNNIQVHVCAYNCEDMMRKFTFEPCKIAYQYNANVLLLMKNTVYAKIFLDDSKSNEAKSSIKISLLSK